MKNLIILFTALIISILVIAPTITSEKSNTSTPNEDVIVATDANGKQIIQLTAKGGYSPSVIQAKAGQETILRVKTNNTFDCSSSIAIPSLGFRKRLPPTGSTDIEIGSHLANTQLDGTCSMGMYNFSINFN